jgi:integrase
MAPQSRLNPTRPFPLTLCALVRGQPPLSFQQVAKFHEDDDKPDAFPPDEVAAFTECMSEPSVYLIQFWLRTGPRTGKLIALQWGEIDLERGLVCVRRSVSRGILKETKGDLAPKLLVMSRVTLCCRGGLWRQYI